MKQNRIVGLVGAALMAAAGAAVADGRGADGRGACQGMPSHAELKTALDAAVVAENSGFNLHMWATLVNRDGVVCAVAHSGANRGAQWPGSRVISAQKANTANAFSLPGLALSTANLYSAVQPGGSLYGLQHSNPVNTDAAYGGNSNQIGTPNDPMVGKKIGGVNVFGGGLGLYGSGPVLIGAVGVSGDTSCTDHAVAWRIRANLGKDHLSTVGGVAGDPTHPDNIVLDIAANIGGTTGGNGLSVSGWGHPNCPGGAISPAALPVVQ